VRIGPLSSDQLLGSTFRDAGGRNAALTILPDTLLQHPESLARFRREAQLLASLNHPHIAVVYSLEEIASGSPGLQQDAFPRNVARPRTGSIPVRLTT